MFNMSLGRMNRFATLAILPGMVLVIMLFAGAARDDGTAPDAAPTGVLVVANLRAESLTFHDLRTGRATLLALPGAPHELVASEGRIYITLGRADLVVEVDPRAPAVLRTMRLAGEPHGIAVHGGNLLVTLDARDAVVTIDPRTLTVTSGEATGDTPHVIAVDGDSVFVVDSRDNTVRLLGPNPAINQTGELPEGLAVAGDYVVTANYQSGSLSLFDRESLEFQATLKVGAGPVRVIALDDSHVAVSRQAKPEVAVVDVNNRSVVKRFRAPDRPDGLCLSPDGNYLAVAGNGTRSAAIFATTNWKLETVIAAGDGPGSCLWLPAR